MSTRVYFGRLNRDVRERDIEKLLRGYGDIREINLKNGFGFVEFRDIKDADDVVYDFNGREFFGDRLIVEHARGRRERERDRYEERPRERTRFGPPTRTQYRLIVENLSSSVSWQDLKDHMRKAGEVTFADCHKYREGEGVVEFATSDGLREAMKILDDTELRGRRIILRADESSRGRRYDSRSPRRRDSRSPRRRDSRSPRGRRSYSGSPRRDRGGRDEEDRPRSRSRSPVHDGHNDDDFKEDVSPRREDDRSPRDIAPADGLDY